MAEEDLDAFFNDVQEAEASAVAAEEDEEDKKPEEPPPAKKQKKDAASVVRPRGVVVAAASNKTTVKSKETILAETDHRSNGIPPPPPLPPPPPPAAQVVGPAVMPPQLTTTSANRASGKPHVRVAAGKTWVDNTLADWPDDDFRIFVGNLESQVSDEHLYQHFSKYASLNQVRVIRDNKGNSKGYGFVSLSNALECAKALREQDQTWLGNRPIRLKRSHWKDRELKERKKKDSKRGRKR